MDDFETQSHFAITKGRVESDRVTRECLKALQKLMDGKHVRVCGKKAKIRIVGDVKDNKFMLDIVGLNDFDHIEFTVTKTGWGRFA